MPIRTAIILGVAFVLAAMAHGGLYGMVAAGSGDEVNAYLFNRFTGTVATCGVSAAVAKERPGHAGICAPTVWLPDLMK